MHNLKISLVTVTYNSDTTIERCIKSVIAQDYDNIEYIIIDGGSTDQTLNIISKYRQYITVLVSEPDSGIYDAMNKGINFATGYIVGTLNSDDAFAGNDVLSCVASSFKNKVSIVYGNLNYINLQQDIIRRWKAGNYKYGAFNWGWMPPHPTFYCQLALFKRFGLYDLDYGTAADFELMLRFMHKNKIDAFYLDKLMINMELGGISNKNALNRLKAWNFDLKAMRKNGVYFPQISILLKPIRKIIQFI
ncbi:MAG: glycosyltransferase family 2 protein [Mucilaginibacter sp.]